MKNETNYDKPECAYIISDIIASPLQPLEGEARMAGAFSVKIIIIMAVTLGWFTWRKENRMRCLHSLSAIAYSSIRL